MAAVTPKITFSEILISINAILVIGSNGMIHFAHRLVDSELSAVFVAILGVYYFFGWKRNLWHHPLNICSQRTFGAA